MWFYIKWRYGNFVKIKFFTAWKVYRYGVFSGPCFLVFGPWTEIYPVNLRIQSEYRKIQTRKNSVFGHFPRSEYSLKIVEIKERPLTHLLLLMSTHLKWLKKTKFGNSRTWLDKKDWVIPKCDLTNWKWRVCVSVS